HSSDDFTSVSGPSSERTVETPGPTPAEAGVNKRSGAVHSPPPVRQPVYPASNAPPRKRSSSMVHATSLKRFSAVTAAMVLLALGSALARAQEPAGPDLTRANQDEL